MSFWTVSPEWNGETAFLLACGPSLHGFNASLLKGQHVIAINDNYVLAPWAEILYFCDRRWWQSRRSSVLKTFTGKRIVTLDNQIDGILALHNTGKLGLETDPGAIRHGSNSGYQAINLAYHLGAKRIVLLGYDMHVQSNRLHSTGRPEPQTPAAFQQVLNKMRPNFDSLVAPLKAEGVEVLNATPGSWLTAWPIVNLHSVLEKELCL